MFNFVKILVPMFMMFMSLAASAHHSSPWDGYPGDRHGGRYCENIRYERECYRAGCDWTRRYGCVRGDNGGGGGGHGNRCEDMSRGDCRRTRGCDWNSYYNRCIRG